MESEYSSLTSAIDDAGILVFDPDVVDIHNVAASYYTHDQALLREPKVKALIQNLNTLMDVSMLGFQAKMPSPEMSLSYLVKPVLIVSTDNRESRVRLLNMLTRYRDMHNVEFIIDARSGWDVTRIFTCLLDDEESVEKYANSMTAEGQRIPCSARAVAYNSMGVASVVSAIVKSYTIGDPFPTHVMQDYKTWTNVTQTNVELERVYNGEPRDRSAA